MRQIFGLTGIFLFLLIQPVIYAQNWTESLDFSYSYDLKGTRILTIVTEYFNYEETVEMSNLWKSFGAEVDFAGPVKVLTGEEPEFQNPNEKKTSRPELRVDYLIAESDPSKYDVIYFAGGEGTSKLIQENEKQVAALIDEFYKNKKIIAAICHAPQALSVTENISGKKITANGDNERESLRNAGAVVVDDICVIDYPFITGQWPFLQTFAFTIAERIQFPEGNGPFYKYMQNISPEEKMLSALRGATQISADSVDPDKIKKIIRAAMSTPPLDLSLAAYYPFKLVVVNSKEVKSSISAAIYEKTKNLFTGRGIPASVIEQRLNDRFVQPPNLFAAVIDTGSLPGKDKIITEITLRNNMLQYGAAKENMIIMSKMLDLSVCFAGYPIFLTAQEEIKKILGIPENYILIDMFSIGYAESLSIPPVSASIEKILIEGSWKN